VNSPRPGPVSFEAQLAQIDTDLKHTSARLWHPEVPDYDEGHLRSAIDVLLARRYYLTSTHGGTDA
jgi:hypothetical protein